MESKCLAILVDQWRETIVKNLKFMSILSSLNWLKSWKRLFVVIGQFNSDDKFGEIQKELLFRLPNISRKRERERGVHIYNSKISFKFYKLKIYSY